MAIEIGIQGFSKTHGKDGSGGGGTTIINGGGGTSIPSNLSVNSISASQGNIRTLSGTDLDYNDANFRYLSSDAAQINKIKGSELNYTQGKIAGFQSDYVKTGSLTADEMSSIKGYIKSLLSDDITTEYLTVTKQAHFFELIIDKVRAVGGTLMMTQAQAVLDYVKAYDTSGGEAVEIPLYINNDDIIQGNTDADYYDCFFLAQDNNTGKEITNDWIANDQAYCQSFGNVSERETNQNISNKYYWRLVTAKLDDRYMNLTTGDEISLNDVEVTIGEDQIKRNEWNTVIINQPYVMYVVGPNGTQGTRISRDCWEIEAQSEYTTIWNQTHDITEQDPYITGEMWTQNTSEGIIITLVEGASVNATVFGFGCSPARLNVEVYYVNGTSEYFPAPTERRNGYTLTLSSNSSIEKIIITNADVVEWKLVHGIRLSCANDECSTVFVGTGGQSKYLWTSSVPDKGDNITQLGYRWHDGDTNEKSRGNAIIIAAYKSPDAGCQSSAIREELAQIKPPSYAQYHEIGSVNGHYFDLAYYRRTYMDGNGSKFYGKFYAMAGGTPKELGPTYVHIAYANSADGSQGFTKTPAANVSYSYTGICSNTNASDEGLVYSDYEWSKNSTSITFKLIDNGSQVYTKVYKDSNNNWKKSISASLYYKVLRMEGTNVRYMTVGEMRNWTKKFNTCTWGSPATSHDNYDGFFPYVKIRTVHKENGSNVPGYRYYRMALNDNQQHSNDSSDAVFTWAPADVVYAYNADEDTTGPIGSSNNYYMTIKGNDDISIKLIEVNLNSTAFAIPTDYSYYLVNFPNGGAITNNGKTILDYVDDGISLSINSQATSAISVLEDQISLRSSTTDSISELTVGQIHGMQGIQGIQGVVASQSTQIGDLNDEIAGMQGAIIGMQSDVSAITQQSNQISLAVQKVYGSVGIKNEFGFNTGARSYDNDDYRTCLMWPYGYGIIGWGRLNRVCQLNIRESVDETWTLSCYMKANAATTVNVNFCDINAVRIYKNGEQIALPSGNWVSVGTSYDRWEFVFEHVNDVNHGGSTTIGAAWGGFFDFEQPNGSLNTIHVNSIVLTRGEKPNCEFAMAEEDLTYAGSGQDFTWDKGVVTLESDAFRGYPVYRNTSYPSEGNYLDIFTYDTYTIKDHMPYTLSFWAKASVMNTYIESFMWNNDIHSIPSGVVDDDNLGTDGRWRTYLSTDWQYYTVKWVPDLKTTQWPTDYEKRIIACRISYSSNSQHSGYVYLAGVTLQEGWVEGMGGTTSSLIKQTADKISLSVTGDIKGELQRTGIDITSGNINLQADKVTFSSGSQGTQGYQSGKIWIDNNSATLHTENADINGKITATSGQITGKLEVKETSGQHGVIYITPKEYQSQEPGSGIDTAVISGKYTSGNNVYGKFALLTSTEGAELMMEKDGWHTSYKPEMVSIYGAETYTDQEADLGYKYGQIIIGVSRETANNGGTWARLLFSGNANNSTCLPVRTSGEGWSVRGRGDIRVGELYVYRDGASDSGQLRIRLS